MNYRPEIDGLRSIALLTVILYHAGFPIFGGGFVGVDIFFVISGYLITSIILAEKQAGSFTLLGFYNRRVRRILPALYFILFISAPACLILLSPSDGQDFWQSLSATILFASNILFFVETSDYFSLAAQYKPLLHTWSLAVEEQFYVLYPLILLGVWRFGAKRIIAMLGAIAVVSLAAAQWMSYNNPAAGFFLLPTRAWELLIGALVAFQLSQNKSFLFNAQQNRMLYEVGSAFGLAMIGAAVLLFDESTPFPSLFALLPTLGAALIILSANPQTLVGRLLGHKFFVVMGLMSYSAYLWHQPLFAFAKYYFLAELSTAQSMIVIVATFGLAALSWQFVEQPFRRKNVVSNRAAFSMFAVLSLVLFSMGVYGHVAQGFKNAKLSFIAENKKDVFVDFFSELNQKKNAWAKINKPDDFINDSRKKILILGDSMSGDFLFAVTLNGKSLGTNQFVRQDLPASSMEQLLIYLIKDGKPDVSVRDSMKNFDALKRLVSSSEEIVLVANWTKSTIPSALKLAEYLAKAHKQVYVVDAPRIFHMSASSFYFADNDSPMNELNQFMYKRLSSDYLSVRHHLNDYFMHQQGLKIKWIDKGNFFCDFSGATCALYSDTGVPLFFDELHLTVEGIKYFGNRLEKANFFIQ